MHDDDTLKDRVHEYVLELLGRVIKESHPLSETDEVARALLFLLLRVSNTWRSIRTLDKHTPDDEGPMVDTGTLLRAMFDAYIQAEYIVSDKNVAAERAKDYLEFQHVEKYKRVQAVMRYDNPFSEQLKSSPNRADGERRLQQEFDRVKARYYTKNRRRNCKTRPGAGMRTNWYPGSLADIARSLGKSDEYDILLANFHGCVHSSALTVQVGPIGSRKHVLDWASTIAVRVARLSVQHNRIELDEFNGRILEELCKPYF